MVVVNRMSHSTFYIFCWPFDYILWSGRFTSGNFWIFLWQYFKQLKQISSAFNRNTDCTPDGDTKRMFVLAFSARRWHWTWSLQKISTGCSRVLILERQWTFAREFRSGAFIFPCSWLFASWASNDTVYWLTSIFPRLYLYPTSKLLESFA